MESKTPLNPRFLRLRIEWCNGRLQVVETETRLHFPSFSLGCLILKDSLPIIMEQGNHYPNSQRGYGHAQNENHPQPPQAGVSWNNSYHTAYANTPTTGYVHSGYQAAIHGSAAKATTSQQNTWSHPTARPTPISNSHGSLGTSRPPRYGPGGPVRCSYPDCPYSGYTKDVEIHRMDRHLIFPPGYKHKNGPPDGEIGLAITCMI